MSKIQGAIVAIVTPFVDGKVDEQGLKDLVEFHIDSGTHGIVPCGTTGESATLNFDEHKRVIELTVKTVNGRVPVIAGTGANNTAEAIELTESAKASGADGFCLLCLITISRARKDCFNILKQSPRLLTYLLFCIMCQAVL